MSDHYFSQEPESERAPHRFEVELRGKTYIFHTDAGVFSRAGLDFGTRLLIETLSCGPGETVLDLGCGYGPIGIVAAGLVGSQGRVFLVDINERAVELAKKNLTANGISNGAAFVSDGLQVFPGTQFDWVLSNPPIRAGKTEVHRLLSQGYRALKPQGCLLVVIRTKQGAKSLQRFLFTLAGNCDAVRKKSGFRILKCCKDPLT